MPNTNAFLSVRPKVYPIGHSQCKIKKHLLTPQ